MLGCVPYLSVKNADEAIAFYQNVFAAETVSLLRMPDQRVMHCELTLFGSRLFVSEELLEHGGTPCPATLGATTVALHLYVDDCDEVVEQMRTAGANILAEPADLFWGERFARARDPFGHEWGISTKIRDMTPAEIQAAAQALFEQQ